MHSVIYIERGGVGEGGREGESKTTHIAHIDIDIDITSGSCCCAIVVHCGRTGGETETRFCIFYNKMSGSACTHSYKYHRKRARDNNMLCRPVASVTWGFKAVDYDHARAGHPRHGTASSLEPHERLELVPQVISRECDAPADTLSNSELIEALCKSRAVFSVTLYRQQHV